MNELQILFRVCQLMALSHYLKLRKMKNLYYGLLLPFITTLGVSIVIRGIRCTASSIYSADVK